MIRYRYLPNALMTQIILDHKVSKACFFINGSVRDINLDSIDLETIRPPECVNATVLNEALTSNVRYKTWGEKHVSE